MGNATAGKATYDKSCKSCHGSERRPQPEHRKGLKVDMKDLGSSDVQSMSDADLKKDITGGMGKMKPQKVSGADLDNVVAYIRTLKK